MASHQTFSGQLWHLTDQTKFDQTNLLYIINGEVNTFTIGKQMSGQVATLIISTATVQTVYLDDKLRLYSHSFQTSFLFIFGLCKPGSLKLLLSAKCVCAYMCGCLSLRLQIAIHVK